MDAPTLNQVHGLDERGKTVLRKQLRRAQVAVFFVNAMDKPVQNADATTDIYFGPKSPGAGKNWMTTVPGKGSFTIFRLYGPKK